MLGVRKVDLLVPLTSFLLISAITFRIIWPYSDKGTGMVESHMDHHLRCLKLMLMFLKL